MKPIRINALIIPAMKQKKIPMNEFYVFIFIAQAMYFSVYQHVCEAASTNVLLVLTVHSNTVFHSLNEKVLNESSEPVIQRSIQMVSLV